MQTNQKAQGNADYATGDVGQHWADEEVVAPFSSCSRCPFGTLVAVFAIADEAE
jgi:hypothetical protein